MNEQPPPDFDPLIDRARPAGATAPWEPPPATAPPQPWGPWATIGWTVQAMLVSLTLVTFLGVALAVALTVQAGGDPDAFDQTYQAHQGLFDLSLTLVQFVAALLFLMVPILIRKWRYTDYIALTPCPAGWYAAGIAAMIVFLAIEWALHIMLDRPVPQWMIEAWQTVGFLPLLFFVVIIAAPLCEEVFFRGFMYRGIAESRWGPTAATFLTSLLWTAIHVQYGLYELALIFVLGLLLGYVRQQSGSIWPCIVMHFTVNLVATVQLAFMMS